MPIETLYAARNIDFAPTINIDYMGGPLPLAGAAISIQIREYPGAAGDPAAEDASMEFADGAHPDARPSDVEPRRRLTITPAISKDVLAALPGLNEPVLGDAQEFVYEIKITYSDGMQDRLLAGAFIVDAGVNYL